MCCNRHPIWHNEKSNYSGGCKAMYHTLLEGVWFSDIGRMAEVRNVPHLAWQGVSTEFVLIVRARCE